MLPSAFLSVADLNMAKACRDFCNSNAAATSSTKSPELLASYCDQLLKKSNKDLDAESLETALEQAVSSVSWAKTFLRMADDR